jgi:hypothetical protein
MHIILFVEQFEVGEFSDERIGIKCKKLESPDR